MKYTTSIVMAIEEGPPFDPSVQTPKSVAQGPERIPYTLSPVDGLRIWPQTIYLPESPFSDNDWDSLRAYANRRQPLHDVPDDALDASVVVGMIEDVRTFDEDAWFHLFLLKS
jgi:hypothetical protein